MADIFAGTQPPAWLERMTAQEPGMLGQIFGDLVGGLANASEDAIQTASDKQAKGIDTNWIKELPGSIKPGFAEARLNAQNPLWKMQAQQAQLNMAQQGIAIQNQQSLIDARRTKLQMQQHDQEVLPQWLQNHPTWESRQDANPPNLFTTEGQRMLRDIQLGDAGNIKHKSVVEGINAYAKSVAELQKIDPMAAAPFAAQIGKIPTPDLQAQLGAAMAQAKDKQQAQMRPVPMDITLGDGTVVRGVFNQKTGKFTEEKPDKTAEIQAREQAKVADEQRKAQIDVSKTKVKELFKDLNAIENQSPDRQKALKSQYDTASKELNDLLAAPPSPPVAPAPTAGAVRRYDPATDSFK